MPRYFFDVHDGFDVIDDTGRDLAGTEAAKGEAMRIATGFAANPKMLSNDGGAIVIVIRDGPDSIVRTVRLVFIVEGG